MPRPPYTTETTIVMAATGLPTISLLEIDGDPEIADLAITPIYDGRSIPLSPMLEWLATNRPELLVKAQSEAEHIKEQGTK